MLAALGDEDAPPSSQAVAASRLQALEEQDSILSQVNSTLGNTPDDAEEEEKQDEETLEMSQRVDEG